MVEKAAGLAEKVMAAPFALTLDQVRGWGDPVSVVLTGDDDIDGVERLHTAIHKALVSGTMAPRREPELQIHVAVLRDKPQVAAEPVEAVSWTAEDFVMLDSVQDDGRIEVLGRWPLIG